MSVFSRTRCARKGVWGIPILRSKQKFSVCSFCKKGNRFYEQNRDENFSRRGRRLRPIMQRSGVVCFASPEWGVQNRYWVNTTHFVYCISYPRFSHQKSLQNLKKRGAAA